MELWYSLLSVLPFDWAQPGQMYFMKHALLAVLVITPLFGILSTMVVHSRMSFSPTPWAIPPSPAWPSEPFVASTAPRWRR